MHSTLLLSALAALSLAQEIDFTQVDASEAPPIVAPPVGVPKSIVSIQSASTAIAIGQDAVTDTSSMKKRSLWRDAPAVVKRDGDCSAQPSGTGPSVTTPDDSDSSFLAYKPFQDAANAAAAPSGVPQGYSLAFSNLQGSSQTTSYLGYKTLDKYDPVKCANYCDQLDGCQAFNLYYERDPSQDANSASCPNPASLTNIKCVRWGVQVSSDTATNTGQWRDSFHVVIAGSNGYIKNAAPPSSTGFSGPLELGGAINAPSDPVTSANTYMGYKFFSFADVQTYTNGVSSCLAACTAQTAYNAAHPPAAPATPDVCNQAVVYVLSDENQPQGIYCAMYSEAWAAQYGVNYGQYRGNDYWGVSQAYAYTNATYASKYAAICDVGGCPGGSYRGGNCGGYGAGTC